MFAQQPTSVAAQPLCESLEPRLLLSIGAIPAWMHLSSSTGDLPASKLTGTEQTASLVFDVDRDGRDDFMIAERTAAPSVVWFRREDDGWAEYLVDNTMLPIEASGAFADIDGDGDLDVVFGGDYRSNQIWWWENPYPNFDPDTPWVRRTIKNTGAVKHHDQIFGDFDGDGQLELVTWNQGASQLLIADIPADPKTAGTWTFNQVYSYASGQQEGLAAVDVNLDGKIDIVGGGRWFEHVGGTTYVAHVIDASMGFAKAAAGQLVPGGRPEIVFSPGDADEPLRWYQWNGSGWVATTLLSTVFHGHSLEIADINGDGWQDIFSAEMHTPGAGSSCQARIFYGDGTGQFTVQVVSVGIGNHESRLGDLDDDGDLDILTKPYTWDTPRVDVWLNNGTSVGAGTSVAARHLFYNNSALDGNDPAANAADDAAIDATKQALLPGMTAGPVNRSAYGLGVNGVMVDIADLPGTPTAGDFVFRAGNTGDPSGWPVAAVPQSVTVRPGAGEAGSDRVTIIWADGAIQDTWLSVEVLATANTGLAASDVFYWGHLGGDYNGSGGTTQMDLDLVLLNWGSATLPPEWVSGRPTATVGQTELDGLLLNWGEQLAALTIPQAAQTPSATQAEPAALTTSEPDVDILAMADSQSYDQRTWGIVLRPRTRQDLAGSIRAALSRVFRRP